jgi:hypothetical protein
LTSPSPASSRVIPTPAAGTAANPPDSHSAGTEPGADPADQESLNANPFDLTGPGPHAKAEVDEKIYSFGEMLVGEKQSYDFIVRNVGKAPLKLAKGKSTCKCTIPSIKDEAIPPGGEVKIHLEWEPKHMDFNFRQMATVWTNDPDNPSLELGVEGRVTPEGFTNPEGSINLGEVKQNEARTVTGTIIARKRADLAIESIEGTGGIIVEHAPMEESALKEYGAASGFTVTMTVPASTVIGPIRESVTARTNLASLKEVTWQLHGARPGPVKIVGQSWYAAKQLVTLGRFSAAEGTSRKLSLFAEKEDELLQLTGVESDGPIQVRIEHDPTFANADRERYWLWIEFPQGAAPGRRMPENPLPVTLSTSRPSAGRIVINVSYEAT